MTIMPRCGFSSSFGRFFCGTTILIAWAAPARALDTSLTLGLDAGAGLVKYSNNGSGSGTIFNAPDYGVRPGFTIASKTQKTFFCLEMPIQKVSLTSPSTAALDRSSYLKWGTQISAHSIFFDRADVELRGTLQSDRLIDATEGTRITLVSAQLAQVRGNLMFRLIGDATSHGGLGAGYIQTRGLGSNSQRQGSGISIFSYFTGGSQRTLSFRSEFLIDTLKTEFGSQGLLQVRFGITWDIPFYKRVVPTSSSEDFSGS